MQVLVMAKMAVKTLGMAIMVDAVKREYSTSDLQALRQSKHITFIDCFLLFVCHVGAKERALYCVFIRERTRLMFTEGYDAYVRHAFPLDELRPLSCDGKDTWGSYSLTLIDSLDTLLITGNVTEFRRVYHFLADRNADNMFNVDLNVSVFETNIRILGGLLSAHLFAHRAGVASPGWPCRGPLLSLAESLARRLLPAFNTPTGMPYGTVNLRHGVPRSETPVTCTAGVATFIVEFGALSRLTGDPVYEDTAMQAIRAIFARRSSLGLLGNHIDVVSGQWTATESGIGAGVDSLFEYLVKGAALLNRPELKVMFEEARSAIDTYLKHDDWYFWVAMNQGVVTMPVFQSLESFWPGLLSLLGDDLTGAKTLHNYHQIWNQYGFLPEFYNVPQGEITNNRDGYPLRPELVESAMYLYRATKDPFFITVGEDMLHSIETSARTECGYATVKSARDHTLEDRMESFFLSETLKYLYLLFDPDNFIHNDGGSGEVIHTDHGQCVADTGGYVFNTEAHPVDTALLQCCHGHSIQEIKEQIGESLVLSTERMDLSDMLGDLLPNRVRQLRLAKDERRRKEKQRQRDFQLQLERQRKKDREAIRRKQQLRQKRKLSLEQLEKEQGDVFEANISHLKPSWALTKSFFMSYNLSDVEVVFSHSSLEEVLTNSDKEKVTVKDESSEEEATVEDVEESQNSNDVNEGKESSTPLFTSSSTPLDVQQASSPPMLLRRQSKDESIVDNSQEIDENKKKKSFSSILGDLLHQMLPDALVTRAKPFDYSDFVHKVRNKELKWLRQSGDNASDYGRLRCGSRPFESRFSVQGEFFEDTL